VLGTVSRMLSGNDWIHDVLGGFGWLIGGRDRKSLVQWLAGNKDLRDNPDFNNLIASPDDPSFYSRKSDLFMKRMI
jgi:hypothetical protein